MRRRQSRRRRAIRFLDRTLIAATGLCAAARHAVVPATVERLAIACSCQLQAASNDTGWQPYEPSSACLSALRWCAVLVAATLTAAVVTGGESEEGGAQDGAARSAGAASTSRALELAAEPTGRPLYDKDRAAVKAGKVEIRLANASSVPHNVTITRGTRTVAATETIKSGSTTLTVSLPPGDYVFFCSVDAHRGSGMEGALTAS